MPEENYQKIKLLKIMEILRQETDEEHPMTKVELAARLVARIQGIPHKVAGHKAGGKHTQQLPQSNRNSRVCESPHPQARVVQLHG